MKPLTLFAPDISCAHCKHTIETELPTLTGVGAVQVEIPARTVHILYDDAVVDEPAIRARLDEIGYPAEA